MSRFLKLSREYSKKRNTFGRQPLFVDVPEQLLDSIEPNHNEQKLYMLRNPVHREVQATNPQTENDSNTPELVVHEQGINHTEGGWPREVHLDHEEQVHRHRRRVLHDENYIHAVNNSAPAIQHYLDQNNAIDMYRTYFIDMPPQEPPEKYIVRISNTFHDRLQRPVRCVVWTNERKSKLAVCYGDTAYSTILSRNQSHDISLWDTTNQTAPLEILVSENPCWRLQGSHVNPEVLIGGLQKGTVNIFDIRKGSKAVSSSSIYNSHRSCVTGLHNIHTRTNTEFYTGSPDGQCLWWDMRNLSEPTDRLLMSVRIPPGEDSNLTNAEGVSSLQYDRTFPTKFLCGTESGLVIGVNRMGKTHSEILYAHWYAHDGPVRAVQRSTCSSRMFLTCGDWRVRVWSEEVRSAPIIETKPYRHQVADVTWAPKRVSSYMAVCENGVFYYWDFLRKYGDPVATLQVSKCPLTTITPHTEGAEVAIGDTNGSVCLLQLSENMVRSGPRDKLLMNQTYGRETRREHILDARKREINLKKRQGEEAAAVVAEEAKAPEISEEEQIDKFTEEEYFRKVKDEMQQMDIMANFSNVS